MTELLGVAAGFDREMRIGSLEITAALAVVAALAGRPRWRAAVEIGALTRMQITLVVRERGAHRVQHLRPPVEFGRSRDVDVTLRDAAVSRRHARLAPHDGALYLEDLASRNGTFLNGRRVNEVMKVRQGDEIDIGTTRIVVSSLRPE